MAAAAAAAAKLIERMLAIFGRRGEIVMGRAPHMGFPLRSVLQAGGGPVEVSAGARRCSSSRSAPAPDTAPAEYLAGRGVLV